MFISCFLFNQQLKPRCIQFLILNKLNFYFELLPFYASDISKGLFLDITKVTRIYQISLYIDASRTQLQKNLIKSNAPAYRVEWLKPRRIKRINRKQNPD